MARLVRPVCLWFFLSTLIGVMPAPVSPVIQPAELHAASAHRGRKPPVVRKKPVKTPAAKPKTTGQGISGLSKRKPVSLKKSPSIKSAGSDRQKGVSNLGKSQGARPKPNKAKISDSTQKKLSELWKRAQQKSKAKTEFGVAAAGTLRPKGRARRDIVPQRLLNDGRVSLAALEGIIPKGTKNTFQPRNELKLGFKYEWTSPKSGYTYKLWGHEANPIAKRNFPSSVSANHWTVRISRADKTGRNEHFLTRKGEWVPDRGTRHLTHIPIH